jgi:outer membrane protein assembly factor BamB
VQKKRALVLVSALFAVLIVGAVPAPGAGAEAAPELRERATFPKPFSTRIDPDRHSAREIVVKFHEGTHVRLRDRQLVFDAGWLTDDDRHRLERRHLSFDVVAADVDRANKLLLGRAAGLLAPLFARSEDELESERGAYERVAGEELADLNLYFMLVLDRPDRELAEQTIDALNALDAVEISYPEPLPASPAADIPPTTTINIGWAQGYLLPAWQNGIDAPWANRLPGGRGAGIRVMDIESGWDKEHEDLPGTYFAEHGWNFADGSHGAAVLGVIAAADNAYGATGIVPDVALGLSSPIWSTVYSPHDTAAAVDNAASHLARGDILVVEQHYPEPPIPGVTCTMNCGQFGYLPAESVQAVYDSIRLATAKGIVVVEAAGNGSMNLDNAFYSGRFNRSVRDSGAIMVGAGGSSNRLAWGWSNFGTRVDLQGWGDNVATLGYGDNGTLTANGGDARQWYTRFFNGTSSATPIVAGAAAAVNGVRSAYGEMPYDSIFMRQWLRATGTPQPAADAATSQIGPLPDLSRAIPSVGGRLNDVQPEGVARGWAFHSAQAHRGNPIGVHFYVDGPAGSGKWGGNTTTTVTRTDINNSYGLTGTHGFEYRIPDAFRDDANHTLYAYGIDPSGLQRNVLLDNQVLFRLANVQGQVESIDSNGRVLGWAYASQSSWQSITVRAYVDGPQNGGGTFVGAFSANDYRQDVNAARGISGSHGFDFTLPAAYRDGKPHTLYLYGVDPRGVNNALLATRSFQLGLLPSPSLAPSPLDFGRRGVGSKTLLAVTLSNGGPGSLQIGSVAIGAGPFTLDSKTCGSTLAVGASCVYNVAYRPTTAGQSGVWLTVPTLNGATNSVRVALLGEADYAQAQLDTTTLAFGPLNIGAAATQTVRLSNTGTVPVTLASLTIVGGSGFSSTGCPKLIAVSGSCLVTVTFAPTTAGSRSATLRFDDDGGGPHDVALEGTGTPVGIPTPIPAALTFAATGVGSKSAALNVSLYNSGGAALNVYGASIVDRHWSDFRIATNGCPNGTVLQPASSPCSVTIVFTPRATGPRHAKLSISTSNGPGVVGLTGTGSAPSVTTAWPAFGHGAAHGGWNAEETGIDTQTVAGLHDVWSSTTTANVASSPAIVDGIAVFGADDGNVHAVDTSTGNTIWRYATGGAVRSSPAVADGLVVVGSNDDNVYALDLQTGTLAWSYATRGDIVASPAGADGIVLVGSLDGSAYALELRSGALLWSDQLAAPIVASPAAADHVTYVAAGNRLRAYEAAHGTLLWTAYTNGPIRSSPTVVNGKVFVGSDGGRVYAFNATNGQQAWSIQASGPVSSSPAVADGIVYVGSTSDLAALDAATGATIWGTPVGAGSAPAVANGIVYLSGDDGLLRAYDAWSGLELAATELKIAGSSPAVANGTVLVGTNTGLVSLEP